MSFLSDEDYGWFSKGAYEKPETARELAKTVSDDWDVDGDLTDNHTTTYHNAKTKHTVVAYRGTADKKDLLTDSMVFLNMGNRTKRFKESQDHTKKVIDKYGKQNVSLTGHSLGSAIASSVGKKQDLPVVGFSKARTLLPSSSGKKEKNIRIAGDPFSGAAVLPSALSSPAILLTGGKGRVPKKLNTHSMSNF